MNAPVMQMAEDTGSPQTARITQSRVSLYIRRGVESHLFDGSGVPASGTAIYTLADPRDIRDTRYVGQTRAPRSRYLQHLRAARLWMPDAVPWWIKAPKLRPLYGWIRDLYRDGERLPVMIVIRWTAQRRDALAVERTTIMASVSQGLRLLNIEGERHRSTRINDDHTPSVRHKQDDMRIF